ncbi:hypothetical protein LUX12_16555 [Streptomyces somaliensis]|uniref:hypothetical protein n=1 Tax=Streptomyces somaliensis TaxID=78355 RepID=UPI0020CDFE0F|nr:hypothetical protein [Streptomyces somaliensis]MCP9946049.1 hypothetical protein [Streptomyces somaliensis]MCP9960784.1 hypothetical protein [Streptomyces somaliensis]MCP9973569.1 hypothetical protein [Streptomyces somaliensis]
MHNLTTYVGQLRAVADALEAQSEPQGDPLAPHPDTLKVINSRHTKRGQLNYAVPAVLELQRRIRRCNADTEIPHGDIVALALDTWLRAKGYPPDPKQLGSNTP